MQTAPEFTVNPDHVIALGEKFLNIKLAGEGPPQVPWNEPTLKSFRKAIELGRGGLPMAYRKGFVEPLEKHLERVLALTGSGAASDGGDPDPEPAETVLGAVYCHAPEFDVDEQTHRFGVVIADLFRSFLSREKRLNLNLPLLETLPPLPTFKHRSFGPFTYPVDRIKDGIDAAVAIVSMPSTYRNDPLLWTSLAHETGGHDVTHANPGMLTEIESNVRAWFQAAAYRFRSTGDTEHAELAMQLGEVWAHWVDEATADVCGVLNIGPTFPFTFAPWLAALRARIKQSEFPALMSLSTSGPKSPLDPHPVDLLRPYLMSGVIQSLYALDPQRRASYVNSISELMSSFADGKDTVGIAGGIKDAQGQPRTIEVEIPLELAGHLAAQVGQLIANMPLRSLGGNSLQQLETWSETDEALALQIADGLHDGKAGDHDSTHLLAGGSIAVLRDPECYQSITDTLNCGLSQLAQRDPLWSDFHPHYSVSMGEAVCQSSTGDSSPAKGQ